jgi:hypothetical protein
MVGSHLVLLIWFRERERERDVKHTSYKSFEIVPHKALIVSRYSVRKHSCNVLLRASRICNTHIKKSISQLSRSIISKQSTPKKLIQLCPCAKKNKISQDPKKKKDNLTAISHSFFFLSKKYFQKVFFK